MKTTIKVRLILTVAILLGVAVVIYLLGNRALKTVHDDLDYIIDESVAKIQHTGHLMESTLFLISYEKDLILSKDPQEIEEHLYAIADKKAEIGDARLKLEPLLDEEELIALAQFDNAWKNYNRNLDKIEDLESLNLKLYEDSATENNEEIAKNKAHSIQISQKDSKDELMLLEQSLLAIERLVKEHLVANRAQSNEDYTKNVNISLGVIIIGGLVAILLAVFMIVRIVESLNNAAVIVKAVGKGDFSNDIRTVSKDEIGALLEDLKVMMSKLRKSVEVANQIANGHLPENLEQHKNFGGDLDRALLKMTDKLRDIIGNIYEGADNLAASSEQLSSASQQISQGASELSAATEETNSTIEEINANIQQNKDNAQQAKQIAIKAAQSVEQSSKVVSSVNKSISQIQDTIKVISEIAINTNLLSINAAVEAARAGEYGKGFAVLAHEIRKLADRTNSAASQIIDMIEHSAREAKESDEQLSKVVIEIRSTANLVEEISAASIEQSIGINQLSSASGQMTGLSAANASLSEEIASSAEELNAQAEILKELVSFFKIEGSITRTTRTASKKKKSVADNKIQAQTGGVNLELESDLADKDFESF